MRLHRFYSHTPLGHTVEYIKDEHLVHQWRNVFRYNVGSEVVIFDGSGNEYNAVIELLTNREAKIRLVSEHKGVIPEQKITLFQSMVKKDKMEWVIEKATELGVSRIVPILSERSEKKGFNIERARKIAIEASEQCGRADVPTFEEPATLDISLTSAIGSDTVIVFDGGSSSSPTITLARSKGRTPYKASIFIGPEGGWSDRELSLFKQKGAQVYSLGPLTLRAETAAIVALSMVLEF